MAKGTESKNLIFAELRRVYPDAFWEDEDKILRIPMSEGSGVVEIKVTLTVKNIFFLSDIFFCITI